MPEPNSADHQRWLLVPEHEFTELQRHFQEMVEEFRLGRSIGVATAVRAISLSRLDLECLLRAINHVLDGPDSHRDPRNMAFRALAILRDRLQDEYNTACSVNALPPGGHAFAPRSRPASKAAPRTRPAKSKSVYQFRITLRETDPPVWRRIQVKDCTLDKLHAHIQTAMGWTNSHLHLFRVGDQLFGDPYLMEENYEDMGFRDSTTTRLSKILVDPKRRFQFEYQYDFGDSWEHEILFEGCPPPVPGQVYPYCVEGERACPPEDSGGTSGYAEFLEAIRDPEHEEHDHFLRWCGGRFDPEEFDPARATRRMKRGLPRY